MDPDQGGPKTYGSDGSRYGFGSGSATLLPALKLKFFKNLHYGKRKKVVFFFLKNKVRFDLLPKRSKDDPASEDYSTLAEYRHVTQALQLQHTMLLKIRLK
jgi:hypothetical protein